MELATDDISVSFAGLTSAGTIPRWAKGLNAHRTTLAKLSQGKRLSGVVVVQSGGFEQMEHERDRVSLLASQVWKSSDPVRVVLEFPSRQMNHEGLMRVLRLFRQTLSRLELAYGDEELEGSVSKALIKYQIENEEPKNDPLSEAREVIGATRPLLSESGRLSVKAVASVFGIPWTRLAQRIGSSKQAVDKTPDSASLQSALRPYERVARLRAVLKDADFKAWLNRANNHLDNLTPLELIESDRVEIVADLVEHMLTGSPS